MIFQENWFLVTSVICLRGIIVQAIMSKTEPGTEADLKRLNQNQHDNEASETVDRDYRFSHNYGYGGYGPGAEAGFEFSEGHPGYHVDAHEHSHHLYHHVKPPHESSAYYKALAIKGLLVPLAGVALLGAAAAFVSNPILLQLGVISANSLGRRKRRDARPPFDSGRTTISREDKRQLNELKLLEGYIARVPKQVIEIEEKKVLANYFSCSETTANKFCLERLACELHSEEGVSLTTEAKVFAIIIKQILGNDFVPEDQKQQILKALDRGEKNLSCNVYHCPGLHSEENRLPQVARTPAD